MAPPLLSALGHVALKVGPERFGATVAFYIDSLQFLPDIGDVSGDLLSGERSTAALAATTNHDDDDDDDDNEEDEDEVHDGVDGAQADGKARKARTSARRGRWLIHPVAGTAAATGESWGTVIGIGIGIGGAVIGDALRRRR